MDRLTDSINGVLLVNNAVGVSAVQLSNVVTRQLLSAVNASCTCGGLPMGEKGCCPACEVWHRVTAPRRPPTHFDDCAARVGLCTDGRSPVFAGACACVTCGKEMPKCWDTVCWSCGSTSCYEHSHIFFGDNRWFCNKCRDRMINVATPFHPTPFVSKTNL